MLNREDIEFREKDQPLRDDVGLLGSLVGDVLREQGGDEFFEQVERARQAAIRRRGGDADADVELDELLANLPAFEARELVRAFSTYFQMVNLAERVHRIRRRREYERETGPQPESYADSLSRLRDAGVQTEQLAREISRMVIEPVFTAHPTEAMRRTLLQKQQQVSRLLVRRFSENMTPREEEANTALIRQAVTTAWQTEENPVSRMTVANERENLLFYLSDIIYRVAPVFIETIEQESAALGVEVDASEALHFGSWVGGDMDGNPNVNADTLKDSLVAHRAAVIHRYKQELRDLYKVLSQSTSRIGIDPAIEERIRVYSAEHPVELESINHRHRNMPYRVLLRLMDARLRATEKDRPGRYRDADEFAADLQLVLDSLLRHRGEHAGAHPLRRLLRRVGVFGFHLAALDIRQDSLVFRRSIANLLNEEGWLELDPSRRAARIREAWSDGGKPAGKADDETASTLRVFSTIHECRQRFGRAAIGDVIISMAEGADDVLGVMQLARWGGLLEDGHVPLDIVPLLETVDDLKRARNVMQQLFEDPVYAEHLEQRGKAQRVMLGYSDSSKDGGVAASRWALQQAQSELAALAGEYGVTLTFFHGRGGTVSRGGGRVHRAVVASPPGTVNGRLRITEQGEIINAKYGLRGIALRTLEQMAGSMLIADLNPPPSHEEETDWSQAMDVVAATSRETFQSLVHDDERFYPFFRTVTPIDVIENMKIGSRPASRRAGKGISDLRAIPWVFAWTQNRCLLPAWYGLGSGLAAARENFGDEFMQHMARAWPFFANLLDDVEMVLAKSDLAITEKYFALAPEYGELAQKIRDEHARLIGELRGLSHDGELLSDDPALERSIRLRNPYVDPMSLMQVELLKQWRASDGKDDELLNALFASVNGISQGLQNTG
ncbi:MAG: phosphoenolpyruvate carboxylase [Gammaproteobacteria bacterium]|nr:phosphoenolpyruvate carboxylase [Gammaproteobacteria bacterium]